MRTIKRDIVGAFIFSQDNHILLGKSNRGTYEGMWIIPGGGIEDGETYKQAVIREVFEETGIDISNETIEQMDLQLTGTSRKILKDTNEEVLGDYTFFNFVIRLSKNSDEVVLVAGDDFDHPTWQPVGSLSKLSLPVPSIKSLQFLGVL